MDFFWELAVVVPRGAGHPHKFIIPHSSSLLTTLTIYMMFPYLIPAPHSLYPAITMNQNPCYTVVDALLPLRSYATDVALGQ